MRQALVVLAALALGCGLAADAFAQEPQEGQAGQEGTWPATFTDQRGRSVQAALEFRRVPDPHGRWRAGTGEILTGTLLFRGQFAGRLGGIPLSELRLEAESVSFVYLGGTVPVLPDYRVHCTLARVEDGSFSGACRGEDPDFVHITMTPPDGETR